jgi:hypothetical protein
MFLDGLFLEANERTHFLLQGCLFCLLRGTPQQERPNLRAIRKPEEVFDDKLGRNT